MSCEDGALAELHGAARGAAHEAAASRIGVGDCWLKVEVELEGSPHWKGRPDRKRTARVLQRTGQTDNGVPLRRCVQVRGDKGWVGVLVGRPESRQEKKEDHLPLSRYSRYGLGEEIGGGARERDTTYSRKIAAPRHVEVSV